MKKILVLTICVICAYSAAFAQKLPGKCEAFLPTVLLKSKVLNETDANSLFAGNLFGQDVKPLEKKYWIVYSDRSGNKTYTTPGGSTVHSTLDFNETLRIAQIQNGYALVYSEPKANVIYPQISEYAENKGWISMKNLLLWDVCLADNCGIYYKALLCINADEQNQTSVYDQGFLNPSDESTRVALAQDMRFYFIMKRENGKALLATQYTMSDGYSDKVLYAWVPNASYVPWNQRTCIEPTWRHEDVEYFAAKNEISYIYDNKNLQGTFASQVPFSKKNQAYEQYMYRMPPKALRFPILDGSDEQRYECSSFTTTKGETDVTQNSDPLQDSIQAALEKLSKINLAIVIDGTASMEEYFPAVMKAIDEGCDFFGTDGGKNDVKVGILIYRDYKDGAGLTEFLPFTKPDDPAIRDFLATGGEFGIKSSAGDRTLEEALYVGINTALDRFRFNKDESNLMLVIGDCGNALNDTVAPQQSELVKKLVDKNVNLVSYQVRNLNHDAYNVFNRQLLQMIKNSLQTKYDNLVEGSRVRAKTSNDGQLFVCDKSGEYDLYFGEHKYATQGTTISADVLFSLMTNSIQKYSEVVQKQMDDITNVTITSLKGIKIGMAATAAVREAGTITTNQAWLVDRFGNVEIEENQMVGFRGWTAKRDASGREYYKPVLFISNTEFDELLNRLKGVYDVARNPASDDRKAYKTAIQALVKSMVPEATDQEIDEKGIAEVMNMISGLNETSISMSKGPTLLEITDPMKVKPAQYRTIVSDFKRKYETLEFIKNTNYTYVREFNGAKYYWIPVEDLP